jgi:hypothetical protein
MALQAGDITRRRLEHAEFALRFCTEAGFSLGREMDGYAALPEDGRRVLRAAALWSAQLSDGAEGFGRHLARNSLIKR